MDDDGHKDISFLSTGTANRVWFTVADAVAYCAQRSLPRTAKTIRKWAHRSHLDPENGDVVVRREDVENGFRWVIDRSSLDRKIEQELEFEARRKSSDTSLSDGAAADAVWGGVQAGFLRPAGDGGDRGAGRKAVAGADR